MIPTYNERDTLPTVVAQLVDLHVPALRILVVDDDSPDGTGVVADELAARYQGLLTVLHRRVKEGLGRAYLAGMAEALNDGADVVIQMDADLSHPPTAIPTMVRHLDDGAADVVIGSRYVPGGSTAADWPWTRRLLSRWANFYVNAILHTGVRDATSGYKAWLADTLRAVDLDRVRSSGYAFQIEMNHRARNRGAVIVEIPISFSERADGASKMNASVQLESALVPWRLRRSALSQIGR